MPAHASFEAPCERPMVAIELEHAVVVRLRREAAKRETTLDYLVRNLLGTIAADKLVDAVLNDGWPLRPRALPQPVPAGALFGQRKDAPAGLPSSAHFCFLQDFDDLRCAQTASAETERFSPPLVRPGRLAVKCYPLRYPGRPVHHKRMRYRPF